MGARARSALGTRENFDGDDDDGDGDDDGGDAGESGGEGGDDVPERKRSLGTRSMLREFAREDVRALRDAVAETLKMVDDDTRAWCDDDTVERFLRADKGDLKKAKKRLTKTLAWRHEKKPGKSRCTVCFEESFRSHYMQQIGYDACGRAVVYSDIGLRRPQGEFDVEHRKCWNSWSRFCRRTRTISTCGFVIFTNSAPVT